MTILKEEAPLLLNFYGVMAVKPKNARNKIVGYDRKKIMQSEDILEKLENLAEGVCIKVVYARLADAELPFTGGRCTLRGQALIIIEQKLSHQEKIKVLAQELSKMNWSGVFLPPKIRELLEP